MSVAAPFGVVSNRIRETSYRFQLEMHDLCLLLPVSYTHLTLPTN